jgi:hypothetical protein
MTGTHATLDLGIANIRPRPGAHASVRVRLSIQLGLDASVLLARLWNVGRVLVQQFRTVFFGWFVWSNITVRQ